MTVAEAKSFKAHGFPNQESALTASQTLRVVYTRLTPYQVLGCRDQGSWDFDVSSKQKEKVNISVRKI